MNESRLTSRKGLIYALLAVAIAGLVLLNFLGFFFLKDLQSDILEQLKRQLNQLGKVSARSIKAEDLGEIYPGGETAQPALFYQQLLYEIKESGDLENALLLTPLKTVLVDYRIDYHIGDTLAAVALSDSAFQIALQGEQPEPELREFAGELFLSSFTPIKDPFSGEVMAVLLVESRAKFFATLARFKRSLLYFGLAGLGVMILFAAIIVFAIRKLLTTEHRLQEQTRLAHLGQMTAMVAHEIRNPLSIIKGSADVLQKKYASENEELFSFIPEEIDRLNRLVNDFLQFARKKDLSPRLLNPIAQLESLLNQINDPRVQIMGENSVPEVLLDSDSFKQVMLNILDNARKAIGEDGRIIIETFVASPRPGKIIIKVRDNGQGMNRETLEKIFDPFFSTRATGSGLGMAITRQLTEQMGGTITVDSTVKQGTTVVLAFPL